MRQDRYRCTVYLDVISKDVQATLKRTSVLPFPPFAGMILVFKGTHEFTVKKMVVNGDDANIELMLEDLDEIVLSCSCTSADSCCMFDEKSWTDLGWQVANVRRGAMRLGRLGMFDPDLCLEAFAASDFDKFEDFEAAYHEKRRNQK